jgi:hypothetical protein
MSLALPVGSALYIDTSTNDTPVWTKLSEHNRAPINMDNNRIEKSQRMTNGTLRKIWQADKRNVGTSWSMLPTYSTLTVDGGYGAEDLRSFYYNKGKGSFKVKISYNGAREDIFVAVFSNCTFNMVKRNVKAKPTDTAQEFWDVSITLEEV